MKYKEGDTVRIIKEINHILYIGKIVKLGYPKDFNSEYRKQYGLVIPDTPDGHGYFLKDYLKNIELVENKKSHLPSFL